MEAWMWIVLGLLVIAVLGYVAWSALRSRRSQQLREGFGPEYDRVVGETGDKGEAEKELLDRRSRHDDLDIRPLGTGARTRYAGEWRSVQERFVDEPEAAVREADRLVQQVMAERGYPVDDDFERRAADVSVDHPEVVENFREGHRLVEGYDAGNAGTESLRQAMVHFRSLFEQLLEDEHVHEEARR